jgi:hypothetical protein
MKIQRSVIGRFLQLACKMWGSSYEGDWRVVVFTVTERSCSIEMARDGLLLTYLCNRVDAETNEHVIAVPFELLQDCSNGTGAVDLCEVVENGDTHVAASWSDGIAQCEGRYPAQDLPEYHLLRDVAWHTIDERLVEL